jgi:hypothetical protein
LLASAVPVWKRTHLEVEGLLHKGEADRLRRNLSLIS